MRRLNMVIGSLEAVEINLQAASQYLDRVIRDATEINATELITALEVVKADVEKLHPCVDVVSTLKTLAEEYAGSLEDVERKLQATQIVESLDGVTDKKAAINSVIDVLAGELSETDN